MPDQHALLSASGAHRWLACPPSALLEAELPGSSSAAAEQGTVAHALAEWKLRHALHDEPVAARPVSEWIDAEMEQLTDDYVGFVLARLRDAHLAFSDPVVLVEQHLDFSHVVPGGFGTGDAVIIAEPRLQIIDLKYGQGVKVEARANPQLMLYALGALGAFGSLYDISEVTVTIYQPRRDNVDTWQASVADLNAWADEVVKPRAALAAAGAGEFTPGEHCRFCALASTCRARAAKNLEVARHEFTPPAELSDAEIGEILTRLPQLKSWASDVEAYALAQAVNQGQRWAGMKLVEGRSIRKYTDESAVATALAEAGITDVFDRKLKTITALEKQLGKQRFNDLLDGLVTKPAGKPALVLESDSRPAPEPRCAATEFSALT